MKSKPNTIYCWLSRLHCLQTNNQNTFILLVAACFMLTKCYDTLKYHTLSLLLTLSINQTLSTIPQVIKQVDQKCIRNHDNKFSKSQQSNVVFLLRKPIGPIPGSRHLPPSSLGEVLSARTSSNRVQSPSRRQLSGKMYYL